MGGALDFVQREPITFLEERLGGIRGPSQQVQVIQRPIEARPGRREVLDEGALPGLPSPREPDHRELLERLLDASVLTQKFAEQFPFALSLSKGEILRRSCFDRSQHERRTNAANF